VFDGARDADDDVIEAGHPPRGRQQRPGGLLWLLVLAQAAALVASIAVALHYRSEAAVARAVAPPQAAKPATPTPPIPDVTTVTLRLPAGGGVTGTVVITAAALPGAARGQFTVSAVISGAMPDTYYNLIGNDCSAADGLPDDVWAAGLTGADGTADLIGYPWTGALADSYWLVLDPSSQSRPPGLHGLFAEGLAEPYPAGQPPCPS
jgi:hypothetical protein